VREETLVYEMRPPPMTEDINEYGQVELNFMKLTNYGKILSGEALMRVLPRLEIYKKSMTIIEIKRAIFDKVKYVFEDPKKHNPSDNELNEMMVLHVVDNLPFVREH